LKPPGRVLSGEQCLKWPTFSLFGISAEVYLHQ